MSVIAHCWRCRGTGQMDLDRGQVTEYVTCVYCKGTGDFQERRRRTRRSSDPGAVEALRAVWGDMRGVDKEHVPDEVLNLVRAVIGDELDPHDPASTRGRTS